jgi:DNA/RNA-binding domain of Phe-tRNA-synthetase-like protein
MLSFQYHPGILSRFPQVVGGVILAHELRNGPTPERLQAAYFTEQAAVLGRIGDTPLSELEPLAAWRAAFRSFGVNPTKYRSAVEALLRRLTKKGDIPSINTLVDICNLVSIRYQIPVAAFDVREVHCPICVRFADGDELFTPLGGPEAEPVEMEHPEAGEVIFADQRNLVVARRWCWRQSLESAAREDTTTAIFTVESQHPAGRVHVQAALLDLEELLASYAGGVRKADVLSVDRPELSF